jgi:hypothetical protein
MRSLAPVSDAPTAFLAVCALASGALLLTILATHRKASDTLEYALGASAGLYGAQVGKVHVFTIICVLYLIVGTKEVERPAGPALLLLGAVALLVLSVPLATFVNHATLALSLTALALGSVLIARRVTNASALRMLWGLFGMCTFAAIIAVAEKAGALHYSPVADANGLVRVHSIYTEPDWLGLFSAIGLLLTFLLPFHGRRAVQFLFGSSLLASLLLSGSRVSWAAFSLTFLAILVGPRRLDRKRLNNGRIIAFGAVVLTIVALADPALSSNVVTRVSAGGANQLSVRARNAQRASLELLASRAPWHGLGLSAAGRVGVTGTITSGPAPNSVASNWVLGWWVDAKYLAIPIIALLVGLALRTIGRASGLLLAMVLLNSLYSNAVMEPLTWLVVGLVLADLPRHQFRRGDGIGLSNGRRRAEILQGSQAGIGSA